MRRYCWILKRAVIFETEHFLTRQWTLEDIAGCVSFWNDPDVMKFIGDGTWGGGEEVVQKVLTKYIAFYEAHPGLGSWAVIDKATGQVVGEAALELFEGSSDVEAGYILRKDYWGRGLGTELLRGLLEHGFLKLGLNQIVAVRHPDNLASARVMEKCDMTFTGEVVHEGVRLFKYVISSTLMNSSHAV